MDEDIIKLIVKLTKNERKLVEQRAKSEGLTSSNYVRQLIKADLGEMAGDLFKSREAGRPKESPALLVI